MDADTYSDLPREARKWAAICHAVALVGLLGNGIGFLLGPLIVWLIKKEDHPFIDEQGKEALNFQITMFLAGAVSALLILVLIGFLMLLVVFVMMVVLPIVAAVKANNGEHYRYPFTFQFVS
jgi:uncharacterized Tic20 family protein